MRHLVSGLTAALTALVLGTLIAGAADSARAADAARQQDIQAIVAETSADQTLADATAYRAQLQEALAQLNAAYAQLQARDAAYRELLGTSQANVAGLQAANQTLARQLADASARIQRAETQLQAAQTAAAPRRVEPRD